MNWSKEKISSFAEVATGGTPSTERREFWNGGTIPWLNSGDLNQGIVTKASNFITEEGYKNSSTKLMPPNTVLIALTGATTGLSAILKIEACANQSVTGIFPSKRHYPEFLYYYIRTQRQRILNAAWGGAQPHINQKYVKDYEVPLPPLLDQIKIATVLSKAEVVIKQRKENIVLLDEFLKSTFLKMFGDSVRNEKGWDKVQLSDACKKIGSGATPKGGKESYHKEGISLIRSLNVHNDEFSYDDLAFIDETQAHELRNVEVEENDVLLNITGASVARCCIVPKNVLPARVNQHVSIIRPKGEVFNSIFLSRLFTSENYQKFLIKKSKSKGATREALTKEEIELFKLIAPPVILQNQFAAIVKKTEALKEQFKASLSDLENLYGSLSQRAFKGKLDLSALIITDSIGGNDKDENHQKISKEGNIRQPNKISEEKKEGKRYEDPFEVDEETAKKQGKAFYAKWKKLHTSEKKSKLTWDNVSTEQAANWIKEAYEGFHFNSEMLIRFLMEERITFPNYYSSEELKKYPQTNDADDLKTFVFSALSGENPFLKLEQVFYDAEADNINLNLRDDDYEFLKDKSLKDRSGIYLRITS